MLLTDQQLFCVRREGSTLLCSPSIPVAPVAEQQQDKAEDGRNGTASLTAVGALYCIAKMSEPWWAQLQHQRQLPQPQPQGGRIIPGTPKDAAAAAAAPLHSTPPPSATAESELTSSQLFQGCNLGPPVPGETVPRCLGDSRWGVVLQGSLGGWPAAVKLVDLWQRREGKARGPEGATGGVHSSALRRHSPGARVLLGGWQLGGVVSIYVLFLSMLSVKFLGRYIQTPVLLPLADRIVCDSYRPAPWPALSLNVQREVRMYHKLQPLQGLHVPRLLGYGYCDGWQYFVVREWVRRLEARGLLGVLQIRIA